ncbi:MAG: hypothetical protein LBC87_01465 [Fibromonadaceae bacterium]|jgi:tetratricopeptide (TPR) repeat protein|nr:hypothetical protein [Fibromonadaceae bacterium]
MKQIVCEMCGGKDLIKQDGVFTCQNCGSKYSVEEAKKMMVTIDTSTKLENALKNARRARECKDYEQAEKYYSIVKMEDPENWEANFYSTYSKAYLSSNVSSVKNCIKSVLKDIKKLNDKVQQNEAIKQISTDIFDFASKTYDVSIRNENRILLSTPDMLTSFGETLISEFGENEFTTSINIQCYEITLELLNKLYNSNIDTEFESGLKNLIQQHAEEMKKFCPKSHGLEIYEAAKKKEEMKRIDAYYELEAAFKKEKNGRLIKYFIFVFIFCFCIYICSS